jgi:hypothetical protein
MAKNLSDKPRVRVFRVFDPWPALSSSIAACRPDGERAGITVQFIGTSAESKMTEGQHCEHSPPNP